MDAGSGQLEKCRSPLASGGAAAVREQSPRFTGFGRSRGDAGIGRIAWLRRPWLQQANAGHPWPACARSPHHRVFRQLNVRGFVDAGSGTPRRSGESHIAKDVAARGFRPSGTWMYRARVLEQDAEPRGGRNPLVAAAPAEVEALLRPCSGGPLAKPTDSGAFQAGRIRHHPVWRRTSLKGDDPGPCPACGRSP